MKQLGDITAINGAEIEPVDCITFGSPCQDLSIAGRRAGLAGERSGLFVQAARIIREMRDKTHGNYPTFAIWENVPGAYSSNRGEDFRAVLEELARIGRPEVTIHGLAGGKWQRAGAVDGDGWSIAWRTLDAQYWGVPQRRRRIALVVDFAGGRAGKILFEQAGLPGDIEPSMPAWEGIAGNPFESAETRCSITQQQVVCVATGQANAELCIDVSPTLNAVHEQPYVVHEQQRAYAYDTAHACAVMGDMSQTLTTRGPGAVLVDFAIRRLTPTECERLQGYPDGWTDIGEWVDSKGKRRKSSNTLRYKALGNSLALPQWWWLTCKMADYLPAGATLGSLFDGIGGFPLVWERRHGTGTARWASEIDDFAAAVTAKRFGED